MLTAAAAREKLHQSPELAHVLRTIRRFNPEGEMDMPEASSAAPDKPRKRGVVKKAAKPAKKSAPDNLVTLADLAAAAKVEPMTARRYLRNSKIKMGTDARWAWPKGSAALGEVKKLLASISK